MSTTQVQQTEQLRLKAVLPDGWQADLERDGYCVVKGAVPRERADRYVDRLHSWLEGL